ncbi:MAG: hypothetical protein NC217_00650 [Muribaculaceae bacterium]|nr:hypothetical protein [Muribaculaceae bacterium]
MKIKVPISKSIAARLLVIDLLGGGDPSQLLMGIDDKCEDIEVMQKGVNAIYQAINSDTKEVDIDLKDSGTAKRLLTAVCASIPGLKSRLRMSERLAERPINSLRKWLEILTFSRNHILTDNNGELNIEGRGYAGFNLPLEFDDLTGSQTLTALMLVAPTGHNPTKLSLPHGIASFPYTLMTAELMRRCGIYLDYEYPYRELTVYPGEYTRPDADMLERDWSAASFFYEYAFVTGKKVEVEGLTPPERSLQGDSAIVSIFNKAENGVYLKMTNTPDLVPPVAIGCALRGVSCHLFGITHLRYKESDRLNAIKEALACLGIEVKVGADRLEITAGQTLRKPTRPLPCFNDHRIAMALAPVLSIFPDTKFDNPSCVNKSFPGFWEEFKKLI